jgi:cytochrome c oxidase assembly factor CtaG
MPLAFDPQSLHLAEWLPPLLAAAAYLLLYGRRALTLRRQGRPVDSWRVASFVSGVFVVLAVQVGPLDTIADELLVAHMIQHILLGEIASLFIALGLTGAILAPLLHIRATRPLRVLAHPLVAVTLWAVNLYAWHLPVLYQLAIRHDLVHALEHASFLWFGTLLWLALLGPLPKPRWFEGWGQVGYVVSVRFIGAILGNVLIWGQTVFYPVYTGSDARRGLSALSDQTLAGGVMMVVEVFLTTILLCWLFLRFASRDEERQRLLDLANERGLALSNERAARAASAGTTERLRERLIGDSGQGVPNPPPG